MAIEYPTRPMIPGAARFACMAFGLSNLVGVLFVTRPDVVMVVGGLLVGGAWFAFGYYGGYPLASTVADWHPPVSADAVEEMHRQGVRVIRRRWWMIWLTIPVMFAVLLLVMPLFMRIGHPEYMFLPVALSWVFVNVRYHFSRCPRCGFGFFAKSTSRAAQIQRADSCRHCGLSLSADKT